MSNESTTSSQIFDLLEGTWKGEGRGGYPTVTSFDYRETLVFTRRDEKTLAYEQRAQKRYDEGTEYLDSHWENGFISILENDDLQLVNIQIGGRSEILVGTIESLEAMFRIHFVSKALNNDPRIVSSARTFELEGDTARQIAPDCAEAAAKALNVRIGVSIFAVAVVGNRPAGPDHCLGRDLIGESKPRAEGVLPHVLEDVPAATSRSGTSEFEGAQDSSRSGVGNRRIEIAVLAMLLESREGQVIAQSNVERQLVTDLDVVLVIPGKVTEDEVDVRAETEVGAVREAQQE